MKIKVEKLRQSVKEEIEFVRDIEIRKGNKLVRKYHVFLGTNT